MIINFSDFCQFLPIFAIFNKKHRFLTILGKNIFKIITSVPDTRGRGEYVKSGSTSDQNFIFPAIFLVIFLSGQLYSLEPERQPGSLVQLGLGGGDGGQQADDKNLLHFRS
jgi:hypothetical protein